MMLSLALSRSVLGLVLGLCASNVVGHQLIAPRACGRTITANKGDTCASLAIAGGITVSQFLQANPSVNSCSQLIAGTTYCVDAPTGTSAAAAAPTGTPTRVSGDGTCGVNNMGVVVTCAGSKWGDCCSQHNFCGGTADYCGTGCIAAYGNCGPGAVSGGGSSAPPPPPPPPPTSTSPSTPIFTPVPTTPIDPSTPAATGTRWVTSTGTLFKTVTSTEVVRTTSTTYVDAGTATGTIYVRSTITVTSTALVAATNTVVVTSTSRALATSTSVVVSTAVRLTTSVVIRTSTSVQTDTLTTITTVTLTKTVTSTAAAGCGGSGQEPPILTTIIPTGFPPSLTPVPTPQTRPPANSILPGTPSSCRASHPLSISPVLGATLRTQKLIDPLSPAGRRFDQITSSDNCLKISRRNSITLVDL